MEHASVWSLVAARLMRMNPKRLAERNRISQRLTDLASSGPRTQPMPTWWLVRAAECVSPSCAGPRRPSHPTGFLRMAGSDQPDVRKRLRRFKPGHTISPRQQNGDPPPYPPSPRLGTYVPIGLKTN